MIRLGMFLSALGGSLLLLQLGSLPLAAAVYYVSPTGDAAWADCESINTPCSWQTAMGNALAGDVVYFRGGIYDPGSGGLYDPPVMNPAHSGTASSYITFQAYPGETPIIHDATGPNGTGTRASIGAYRRSYIIWDGLTLDRNLHDGVSATGIAHITESSHIVLRNMDMIGRPQKDHHNGCLIYIEGKSDSSNIYIYNNRLHGMTADPNPIETVVNASAIWVFDAHHVYISNNDIYDNVNGVSMKSVSPNYVYVFKNHLWDMSRAAINLVQQSPVSNTDVFIYQNIFRNDSVAVHSPDPATPIFDNLKIYNNTVYTSSNQNFVVLGNPSYHPFINTEVYNNIYYSGSAKTDNRGSYIHNLASNLASFPTYLDNNIYYGPGQWTVNRYDPTEATYSTLAAWQAAMNADLNSSTSDPLLINPGGANPADYKLQATSPARSGGRGGSYPAVIGAYITGDEIIGYRAPVNVVTGRPPAAPVGLRLQ